MQQTARTFLHAQVHSAGAIPRDPCVPQAVFHRIPFLLDCPKAPASRAIELLARRIANIAAERPSRGPFFNHFCRLADRHAA
jgi:MinD-like ATPase involved in chromosome partitioning or flagellar assembly